MRFWTIRGRLIRRSWIRLEGWEDRSIRGRGNGSRCRGRIENDAEARMATAKIPVEMTTITIRDGKSLDYLPEPDIFHDIAGHVPMHTDRQFADVLVRFGEFAREAADHVKNIRDENERVLRVESITKALARFFWFTIEFGLMRDKPGGKDIKVYG